MSSIDYEIAHTAKNDEQQFFSLWVACLCTFHWSFFVGAACDGIWKCWGGKPRRVSTCRGTSIFLYGLECKLLGNILVELVKITSNKGVMSVFFFSIAGCFKTVSGGISSTVSQHDPSSVSKRDSHGVPQHSGYEYASEQSPWLKVKPKTVNKLDTFLYV